MNTPFVRSALAAALLLAAAPEEVAEAVLRAPTRETRHTVVDSGRLRRELAEVRRTGAAVLVIAGDVQSRRLLRDALPGANDAAAPDAQRAFDALLEECLLTAPSWSLRGGTREILRNIIGKGLGLGAR